MDFLKAIVLGIVQGITEWLPISSTAHLLIFDDLLKMSGSDSFKSLFMVVVQLGSILAVVVIYFNRLWPFKRDKAESIKSLSLWAHVIVSAIPAAVVGFILDDFMDEYFNVWYVIAIALALYGILYIILEKKAHIKVKYDTVESVSYKKAFELGLFQALAIIPGTSRSGSTILGGIALGLSREVAAVYSFFMAIPVMAGASLLRFIKYASDVSGSEWALLSVATLVSFAVSLAVIKGLVKYVREHDFSAFGIYRIALAIVLLIINLA